MAAIGIEFILRATTDAFTKGMAAANNSIESTKKSLKGFGGGSLVGAIGVAGIVRAFSSVYNKAQETRAELERLGQPVDDWTASVANAADAFDSMWASIDRGKTVSLGFFTQAGEGWGMLINRIRGVTAEQEAQAEAAKKAADAQVEQRDQAFKDNSPEKIAAADKRLAEARRQNLLESISDQDRLNALVEDWVKLNTEAEALGAGTVARREKELEIEKVTGEVRRANADLARKAEEAAKKAADEKKKADAKQTEQRQAARDYLNKFAPTVEALAETDQGTSGPVNIAAAKASKALEFEQQAKDLALQGRVKEATQVQGKADVLRAELSGQTAQNGTLTQAGAETAMSAALVITNQKLDAVVKAMGGIIKAQP